MGLSEPYSEQANDLMTAALSVVYVTILFQLIARSYVSFASHRKLNKRMGLSEPYSEQANDFMTAALSVVYVTIFF